MLFDTLALVGVGLVGGSVGLAARKLGVVRRVIGADRDARMLERCVTQGILDDACTDLASAVAAADLVIFCTPVNCIADQVLTAAPHCRPGTLLTDVGSTKARIVRTVAEKLPKNVSFVGAHPLAGSEKHGSEHANPELFRGRLVVLTPCRGADDATRRIGEFWQALGARVRVMDAADHDRVVALTSHLPHLAASALAGTVPAELFDLTATGFQGATRVAAGNADVWTAIFDDNRDALLSALRSFQDRLELFRAALESGDRVAIEQLLSEGKQKRDALSSTGRPPVSQNPG